MGQGQSREVGTRGIVHAEGLGKREGEGDFGGGWRVGPTWQGGGGSNRPRRTRRARRGEVAGPRGGAGQAAAGPPNRPKAGEGEPSWAAGPRLGRAGGAGWAARKPAQKERGVPFYFPFSIFLFKPIF
jgi:hypothetical protein